MWGENYYFHDPLQSSRFCCLRLLWALDGFPNIQPSSSAQHELKHSHTLGCQSESASSVCCHNHTCLPHGRQSFLLSNSMRNVVSPSGQPPTACFLTLIRRGATSLHLISKPHLIPFYSSVATHSGKKKTPVVQCYAFFSQFSGAVLPFLFRTANLPQTWTECKRPILHIPIPQM